MTRVVIGGGAFAGLYSATYLDETVARRHEAEVVLISRTDKVEDLALRAREVLHLR